MFNFLIFSFYTFILITFDITCYFNSKNFTKIRLTKFEEEKKKERHLNFSSSLIFYSNETFSTNKKCLPPAEKILMFNMEYGVELK